MPASPVPSRRAAARHGFAALLFAAVTAWAAAATPALPELPEASDLAADARLAAGRGVPLVILYSRDDCSWCAKVRREYLGPMARDPETRAVIRELHMDRPTPLVDFAGRRTTSADFSASVKARFAPTVMFHGPSGAPLADAIVGFRLADFYGAYLDQAIEQSRDRLGGRK